MIRFWLTSVILPLLVVVAGCGGPDGGGGKVKTVPLTGKLLVDGQPKGDVSLRFSPQSADGGARTSFAAVKSDGTFAATTYVTGDGIIPGKYEVAISTESAAGSTDPAEMMASIQGQSVEKSEITVPDDGLTDIEIKLISSGQKPSGGGGMLGQ